MTADTRSPLEDFRTSAYARINEARLEHLATLALPLENRRVLELGAGVGDLTPFFLERGCTVTAVEGRPENIAILHKRFGNKANVEIRQADLDDPPNWDNRWEVIFAYGILYHLANPKQALEWMAGRCTDLLLLSTCVSPISSARWNPVQEDAHFASQALHGDGCRPSRQAVWSELKLHMPCVYATRTQPLHEEFPTNWSDPAIPANGLIRCVFVASRNKLSNTSLRNELQPG